MNDVKVPFYKKKWFLISFSIVMVIGIIGQLSDKKEVDNTKQVVTKETTSCGMAWIIAKELIEKKLKSPKSADFPFSDYECEEFKDNIFIIKSFVDATNEFNAEIRTNFKITLQFNAKGNHAEMSNWKELKFEEIK